MKIALVGALVSVIINCNMVMEATKSWQEGSCNIHGKEKRMGEAS